MTSEGQKRVVLSSGVSGQPRAAARRKWSVDSAYRGCFGATESGNRHAIPFTPGSHQPGGTEVFANEAGSITENVHALAAEGRWFAVGELGGHCGYRGLEMGLQFDGAVDAATQAAPGGRRRQGFLTELALQPGSTGGGD